jgi:hypothetical protein
MGAATPRAFTVGSAEDCDIRVRDEYASAHHARLVQRADGTVWVEDLGSTNGTRIRRGDPSGPDEPVTRPTRIFPGDCLVVGRTRIPLDPRKVHVTGRWIEQPRVGDQLPAMIAFLRRRLAERVTLLRRYGPSHLTEATRADVAAQRALLAWAQRWSDGRATTTPGLRGWHADAEDMIGYSVRHLLQPYASHPRFRPEWKR